MVVEFTDLRHGDPRSWRECVCKICGNTFVYRKGRANASASYCDNCRKAMRIKKKEEDPRDKYERRFDNAVESMRSQIQCFDKYESAVSVARTKMYSYGSKPEAMLAIQLLKDGYKIIPQQKIGKYHVDFLIKDQKLIIEVDGRIYHQKVSSRDAEIQLMVGLDWKIIHIPSEYIESDVLKVSEYIKLF